MRIRRTKQRSLILDVLRNARSHPSARWIHQEVRKNLPRVSLGTIYRNLKLLQQEGEVQEIRGEAEFARYDANREAHYHVVCQECGTIVDVEDRVFKDFEEKVARVTGFQIIRHIVKFQGRCPSCQKSGAKRRAAAGKVARE